MTLAWQQPIHLQRLKMVQIKSNVRLMVLVNVQVMLHLEEVVMALNTRQLSINAHTNINTKEIMNTSRLVSSLMGLEVQVNKAITGDNAFAHSSGIHQDGLLKSRDAYEIIHPTEVGLDDMELVLTARSGRHAVKNALEKLGF